MLVEQRVIFSQKSIEMDFYLKYSSSKSFKNILEFYSKALGLVKDN